MACFVKDHSARLWDLATYECIGECVGHTDSIGSIALSGNAAVEGAFFRLLVCLFSPLGREARDRGTRRENIACFESLAFWISFGFVVQ